MKTLNITNPEASPLPDCIKALVGALSEGRVASLIIIAEVKGVTKDDDGWIEGYEVDIDGNTSDRRAVLGSLAIVKRDLMRGTISSGTEYLEIDDIVFGDEDDDDED